MTDSVGTLTLQALKHKHQGKFLLQIKPQPHFPLPLSHHAGTSERGDTDCMALAAPNAPRGSPSSPSTWGHSSTKQTPLQHSVCSADDDRWSDVEHLLHFW